MNSIRSARKDGRVGRRGFVRVALATVALLGLAGGIAFAVWKIGNRLNAAAGGTVEQTAEVVDKAAVGAERAWQARFRSAALARRIVPLEKLSLGPVTDNHVAATRAVWHPDVDTGLEIDRTVAAEKWFATFATAADRDGKRFSPDGNGFADSKMAIAMIRSITRAPEEKAVGQRFVIGPRSHRVVRWCAADDPGVCDPALAGKFSPAAGEQCIVVDLEVAGGSAIPGMYLRDSHLDGADGAAVRMNERLTDAINVSNAKGICRLGFVAPAGFAQGPYLSLVLNNGVGWARVELLRDKQEADSQSAGGVSAN